MPIYETDCFRTQGEVAAANITLSGVTADDLDIDFGHPLLISRQPTTEQIKNPIFQFDLNIFLNVLQTEWARSDILAKRDVPNRRDLVMWELMVGMTIVPLRQKSRGKVNGSFY